MITGDNIFTSIYVGMSSNIIPKGCEIYYPLKQ